MNRPYIICHMLISLDGKVTGDFLFDEKLVAATEEYYRLNREIPAEAFACGRVTMEGSFTGGWYPELDGFAGVQVSREDYIADAGVSGYAGVSRYAGASRHTGASRYAVAFDRQGRLGWKASKIEDYDPGYGGAHIIEVLCETAPDSYLAYLQSIGVSYIFAGAEEMDLQLALEKLWRYFSIKVLLLEGGSEINAAFERAGLVDELSLVQVPVIAGADGKPLFWESVECAFKMSEVTPLDGGALWLRRKKL